MDHEGVEPRALNPNNKPHLYKKKEKKERNE
jgi:hypothetical protein